MNDSELPVPLQLEDRKERAVRRLGTHFAEDHLSVEEFEDRVDRVYSAATPVEVESVFQGLPTLVESSVPERISGTVLPARVRADEVPKHGFQVAIMSGVDRKGAWVPARRNTTIAIMGGAGLDLREARFGPGVTEIRVIAIMGGAEIIVPPGLAVQTRGFGIMGGFEGVDHPSADPDPEAPVVIIKGLAIMGGVEVAVREPGETAREAKRRRRDERKARRLERSGGA